MTPYRRQRNERKSPKEGIFDKHYLYLWLERWNWIYFVELFCANFNLTWRVDASSKKLVNAVVYHIKYIIIQLLIIFLLYLKWLIFQFFVSAQQTVCFYQKMRTIFKFEKIC